MYAFGGEKEAKAYGEFLQSAGIKNMPVWAVDKKYVDAQDKSFARQLWFARLDYVSRSGLVGVGRGLHNDWSTRGVRSLVSTAGANRAEISPSENSELPYTPEQLQRYTNLVTEVRSGSRPNADLEEIVKFFASLIIKK